MKSPPLRALVVVLTGGIVVPVGVGFELVSDTWRVLCQPVGSARGYAFLETRVPTARVQAPLGALQDGGKGQHMKPRFYELVREITLCCRSEPPHAASACAHLAGSLEGLDDRHCPPDGTLRSPARAGRSSREAQQAGLLEARRKPRAPILSSPGSSPTPAS